MNQIASAISQLIKPGDIIWIHDYHFLLLASHLKSMHPEIAVGLFLHIPFPSFSYFLILEQNWFHKSFFYPNFIIPFV